MTLIGRSHKIRSFKKLLSVRMDERIYTGRAHDPVERQWTLQHLQDQVESAVVEESQRLYDKLEDSLIPCSVCWWRNGTRLRKLN